MKRLTKNQQQFINELTERMSEQSNRMTQYPLFVIQVDKKVYGSSEWCNEVERKEESDEDMCENCKEKDENGEEVSDYCLDCDSDCFIWFSWEQDFNLNAGIFFTEAACEEHIKENDYHYRNPRSYVIGAWRNPEMQKLFEIFFTLAGKETPSWYK